MKATPTGGLVRRTPDEATVAIVDARARIGAVRALALLVDRLAALDVSHDLDGAGAAPVRDTIRQLVARTRHTSVVLRIVHDQLVIDGVALDRAQVEGDPLLQSIRTRLVRRGIATVSIRDAAAPGELLTLARLLAGLARTGEQVAMRSGTPTTSAETPSGMHTRELLRTWSVLVLSSESASVTASATQPTGSFARLATARTDEAAVAAVGLLVDDIDDLVARADARALEQVARALAQTLDAVGTGAGRLALEEGLRRLLRLDVIALLATRVPLSTDRAALLSVFARAGEAGVRALAAGLLSAEDALARRAYFDTIVALDLGGSLLRDTLHDERWYVVRNTAALLGEMGIADADMLLVELLGRDDERIRIAAARALIRLRTPRALAALHDAIDDTNVEVRRIAATSYTVATSTAGVPRPTAGRLAAALDHEQDEDVALEMMAAMGRLGSADAVQRLLRIAQSPTVDTPAAIGAEERGYTPRPSWVRIAALEALVDARGAAVHASVEALVMDDDVLVSSAARGLL